MPLELYHLAKCVHVNNTVKILNIGTDRPEQTVDPDQRSGLIGVSDNYVASTF